MDFVIGVPFAELQCPPVEVEHGSVSNTGLVDYEDTVTTTCDAGYRMNGMQTVTCLEDRTYDGTALCEGLANNSCDANVFPIELL